MAPPTHPERRRIAAWVRDAALLLALALCVLSMDSDQAPWRLWWPMPLAFLSGAMTLLMPGRPILRWRHHLWLGVLILLPLCRGLLSLHGPLPAAGLREMQGLMSIALVASALWLVAAVRPDRAFGIWTIAMWIGVVSAAKVAPAGEAMTAPALVVAVVGALMGSVGWLRLVAFRKWLEGTGGMRLTSRRTLRIRREEFVGAAGRLTLRTVSLAAGCVVGWRLIEAQQPRAIDAALRMAEGMRQQELLWTRSLLLGWGHGTLERLMEAFARPMAIDPPPWGGVNYLLATGGLAGLALLLVLLVYMMLWPRGRWGIETEPLAPAAAHWGVMPLLMTGGMLLMGGPRSEMAVLALAGWLALTLVKARIDPARGQALPMSHIAGGALIALTAGVLIFSLAMPTWGTSILLRTNIDAMAPESYRARLDRAARLNEHDPRIRMMLARSWRQTMTNTPGWSESNFLRVVGLYNTAAGLDPYDTLIPMRLAEFLVAADRPAIAEIEVALDRMPKDPALIRLLLAEANREKRPDLAYQMVRRGLMVQPAEPAWWLEQAQMAEELGQIPLAQRSLAIALTGGLDDPRGTYIRAAWVARKGVPAVPPAG
ncbi:MAG: hypothetical protein ABFD69_06470 [Candidatus Sumerlaeia bacterium]